MSEALKVKVSEEAFQDTLDKISRHLDDYKAQRDRLEELISRMKGDAFSGSHVQSAINKCNQQLDAVNKAITKVTAQQEVIQKLFDQTKSDSSSLESTIAGDSELEIPDLFK